MAGKAVSNGSKILKWKQITTASSVWMTLQSCFQWFKDTKMKANHNILKKRVLLRVAVSNGSKILKWKQITTIKHQHSHRFRCFQWFKDTKMKANHNRRRRRYWCFVAVSNGSKILKWKQITTYTPRYAEYKSCFQWFKDTKMKANHNKSMDVLSVCCAVSNGSKILKWKQITTYWRSLLLCIVLFPMVQRY